MTVRFQRFTHSIGFVLLVTVGIEIVAFLLSLVALNCLFLANQDPPEFVGKIAAGFRSDRRVERIPAGGWEAR